MTDRIRLILATAVTSLLLAAVSVAGLELHSGSSAPHSGAPAPTTIQAAPAAPAPTWDQEHD